MFLPIQYLSIPKDLVSGKLYCLKKKKLFFLVVTLDNLLSIYAILPFVRNENKEEYLLRKFVVNIN